MRKPEDLKPGEKITVLGFRDDRIVRGSNANRDGIPKPRHATFIMVRPCGFELKFDKGYVEHWSYKQMLYGLNGLTIPTSYAPDGLTPMQHVKDCLAGRRSHHGRG